MKKLLSTLLLAVAVVATIGSASDEESSGGGSETTAASGGDSETTGEEGSETTAEGGATGEADEIDDVAISSCAKDETLGFAAATIDVTNNSSEPSSYSIEIVFESPDGATQIGTGSTFITSLAPDQTKTEEVTSFEDAGDQEFTCRVESVDRLAA